MFTIAFGVGLLYFLVCAVPIMFRSAFDKRRSTGQKIVLVVLNLVIFLFSFWVYSWSQSSTLFAEALFGCLIVLNPIALIFMPIKNE